MLRSAFANRFYVVAALKDADGAAVAALVQLACHPTEIFGGQLHLAERVSAVRVKAGRKNHQVRAKPPQPRQHRLGVDPPTRRTVGAGTQHKVVHGVGLGDIRVRGASHWEERVLVRAAVHQVGSKPVGAAARCTAGGDISAPVAVVHVKVYDCYSRDLRSVCAAPRGAGRISSARR